MNIEGEDAVVVSVVDDVNRPNNDDVTTVLMNWVHDNYGDRAYEYWEMDACETVDL